MPSLVALWRTLRALPTRVQEAREARRDAVDPNTPPARLHALADTSPDLEALVLGNPAAPQAVLTRAAHRLLRQRQVSPALRALAKNPNLPPELLFRLGSLALLVGDVLENPSFALLVVERPSAFLEAPELLIAGYVARNELAPWLLAQLSEHPSPQVRAAVASRPGLPEPALLRLLFDEWNACRRAAAKNPSLSERMREIAQLVEDAWDMCRRFDEWLMQRTPFPEREALLARAFSRVTERASLEELASLNVIARCVAAAHPDAPESLQRRLAADPDARVQRTLALQSSLCPAAQRRLVNQGSEETHQRLLAYAGQQPERLALLASSRHFKVRQSVAAQARDPQLLTALAQDPDASVRSQVARNLHTPEEAFSLLLRRPDVWRELLENPRTPASVVHALARQVEDDLVDLLARHPNASPSLLDSLLTGASPARRALLAGNPNASPLLLARLVQPREVAAYRALAANPAAPEDLLSWLLADPDAETRVRVVRNPGASPVLLERAGRSADPELRFLAAQHPNTPEWLLAWLAVDPLSLVRAGTALHPQLPEELLRQLVRDRDHWVRAMLAKHPRLPGDLLRRLARDPSPVVRARVARNPNAARDTLERLAHDARWMVRAQVASAPGAPASLLVLLAEDTSPSTRLAVTSHPSTPRGILAGLQRDSVPFVAAAAQSRLSRRAPTA